MSRLESLPPEITSRIVEQVEKADALQLAVTARFLLHSARCRMVREIGWMGSSTRSAWDRSSIAFFDAHPSYRAHVWLFEARGLDSTFEVSLTINFILSLTRLHALALHTNVNYVSSLRQAWIETDCNIRLRYLSLSCPEEEPTAAHEMVQLTLAVLRTSASTLRRLDVSASSPSNSVADFSSLTQLPTLNWLTMDGLGHQAMSQVISAAAGEIVLDTFDGGDVLSALTATAKAKVWSLRLESSQTTIAASDLQRFQAVESIAGWYVNSQAAELHLLPRTVGALAIHVYDGPPLTILVGELENPQTLPRLQEIKLTTWPRARVANDNVRDLSVAQLDDGLARLRAACVARRRCALTIDEADPW